MWSLAVLRILPGAELVGAMLRRALQTADAFDPLDVSSRRSSSAAGAAPY